jgi:hypothetical protein
MPDTRTVDSETPTAADVVDWIERHMSDAEFALTDWQRAFLLRRYQRRPRQ